MQILIKNVTVESTNTFEVYAVSRKILFSSFHLFYELLLELDSIGLIQ